MRLGHLTYFIALETYGSINKVSQALHTTSQNVSRILKQIEDEMGTDLFLRTPGGIIFTPHGKNMLSFAKSCQQQLDEMKLSIRLEKEQSELDGEIILYSLNSANETILNDILIKFQRIYPHIMVNNIIVDWLEGYECVENNASSLGLLTYNPEYAPSPKLKITELYHTHTVAIMHKNLACNHQSPLTIKQLIKEKIAILAKNDYRKTEIYSAFQPYIESGEVKFSSTGNLNAYYQLALSSNYVCFSTKEAYSNQPPDQRQQLVALPLEDEVRSASYALVMHDDASLTLAQQHFIKFIRDYFENIKLNNSKLVKHA